MVKGAGIGTEEGLALEQAARTSAATAIEAANRERMYER
ncbi:unannotated protein [freshwater metagenome]|uniref:Unannotated protein n=1 Tax=freshwater metagenome TaxID=449393 RepID=A0A6J6J6A0_9ZZZZ